MSSNKGENADAGASVTSRKGSKVAHITTRIIVLNDCQYITMCFDDVAG
jgi:hypothetical protein